MLLTSYSKNVIKKNNCLRSPSELPFDINTLKRQCSQDTWNVVKNKVIMCVQLRVSPDFEMPPNDWAYGRLSFEAVPLAGSYMESMCKNGSYEKAMKCVTDVANSTRMNQTAYVSYFDKICVNRANCFKLLDETCLAQYDSYRQSVCECAYDVHELYGGKRLLNVVPSCAGLTNDPKGRYVLGYNKRESCEIEDIKARDYMDQICTQGYDNYLKNRKPPMSMETTIAPPTTKKAKNATNNH